MSGRAARKRYASRYTGWATVLAAAIGLAAAGVGDGQAQVEGTPAPPDSLRIIESAVAADSSFENLYRLGIAYLDRDRALEAVRTFSRCTKLRPDEVKAWVNLGASEDAIGHGNDARKAYRKAIEIHPYDEIAFCRLAASLYASNLRSQGVDTLRVTIEKHPRSYCAYFTLGVAYADAQIYREAIRAWEKVVEFAPDTPEAESARESIATLKQLIVAP